MIRLLAVLIFVITCYYFPSEYSSEVLTVGKIDENAARSLYLCFAIMLVWPSFRGVWIYAIEAILIIADAYTKRNMPSGGIMADYYSLLHESAYLLELAIMGTFIIIEWRRCGNIHGSSFYRNLLDWRVSHNRSGDHH